MFLYRKKDKIEYPRITITEAMNIAHKFENNTKRKVLTFEKIINQPDKDVLNKSYMLSDYFWSDPHNKKMFEFGVNIAKLKEKIPPDIKNLFMPSYSRPDEKTLNYTTFFLGKHSEKYNVLKDLNKVIHQYLEYMKKSPFRR